MSPPVKIQMEYVLIVISIILVIIVWRALARRNLIEPKGLAVFISGCDTGIGNRLAIYFSDIGCNVYAGCLHANESRKKLPETVTVVPLDIRDNESIKRAYNQVCEDLKNKKKNLWALINNAGVCVYGEFEWQTWNQCQRQVEINLLGTMKMIKSFLPLLRRSKGRIITVTSVNGYIAYPGLSVYSATKFALEGLCDALRLELRRQHGIRVIKVQPGDFARLTSIMSQHQQNVQEMWEAMPEEDKSKCGDFFKMYHRIAMKNYGLTSPSAFEASPLLTHMKDAVLNVKPADTYLSASLQYRLFYQLMAMIPNCWSDAILDMITNILYNSDNKE